MHVHLGVCVCIHMHLCTCICVCVCAHVLSLLGTRHKVCMYMVLPQNSVPLVTWPVWVL